MPYQEIDFKDILSDRTLREVNPTQVENLRPAVRKGTAKAPGVVKEAAKFRLIFHHHTYHAMKAEGWTKATFQIVEGLLSENEIMLEGVREQEVRLDFTQTERVRLYRGILDAFGWSQGELANQLGKSEGQVSKVLNRAKRLHPAVYEFLASSALADRAADAIAKLPMNEQHAFAQVVVAEKWKVERVEREVRNRLGKRERRKKPVRITTSGGIVVQIPGDFDYDAALEELRIAMSRLKKGRKLGEDAESAPVLLAVS